MKLHLAVIIPAIAVAFASSSTFAYAVDWPGPGETYTVPANTTNVVEESDMAAFNALGKVIFENEESALRFTSDTAPNVLLEGPGWMIKDCDSYWTIIQQQTDAWYGKWDIRGGTVNPLGPNVSGVLGHSCLFYYYGTKGPYDLYIRKGANVTMNEYYGRGTHVNTVIHLSGKLTLSGIGSAAQLYRIEIENPEGDDSAQIYFDGGTQMYFYNYNSSNICRLNLNGHYLPF